jgi:hypothetical protein
MYECDHCYHVFPEVHHDPITGERLCPDCDKLGRYCSVCDDHTPKHNLKVIDGEYVCGKCVKKNCQTADES